MKLRRWVANENIELETYFLPFIQSLIRSMSNKTIVLVIDGSTVGREGWFEVIIFLI